MSLVLDDVTVRRGIGPVISNVSLEVEPGKITTLVGPNGAGKTSLLEAISGVVQAAGGTITMDGTDLRKLSRRRRSTAGLKHVEQGRMIFPSLTVRENLKLTARTQADFEEALALFPELEKRIDNATVLLSGGEQQMVVLARAFAAKPRYLLLDEMSLGLAPVVFLRLMPIIKQISETGVGVLLVEQFAHMALGVADDAVVVTSGRVSYQGEPQGLLSDEDLLKQAYLG
ncbi:ABC transporter ATP-binding protein [Demequina zhanjiangensis]|uniref:ATP-binding cassette domain-containing protein n=1 Tax=Demequina zhanjiangensis TaxID=3051659 RepID=A0ABT8G5J2_9MICO|nr:ATP-binding cassette domain-containing protein [Demequina sp. SYSU T00b26]MDN4474004.1 ATP-binding cassette domain-containing protein [Demequina sp. SYSU T00b26]